VPAISLVKVQRIGNSGNFTHNDVTGNPGDTDNYQMTVTNTGDTSLVLNFTDANCDSGTLSGPSPALPSNTLAKGASVQYTCSHVLSSSDAPVFTNTANVVGTAPDGTQVTAQDHVNANVNVRPGIQVVKTQRIGNSGPFTHDPVFGKVGDTVNYQMTVTNTGNVSETYTFSDPQCDPGTLSGPTPAVNNNTLAAGQSVVYTCSHVLTASDTASGFTNAACATSGPLQSCDTVIAHVPSISLVKLQRIGNSGNFTHNDVSGNVGDTDNYQIEVTNTGDTPLVLNFTDNQCDAGTLSAPSVVSGQYDAGTNTLSAGGELLYTCSHVLAAGDQPYVNTASVVGTPPSGPPVSATDHVRAFANVPGISVVKLQRDGTSGPFTRNQITASVGDTIQYEIQVTNTGNVPLTLSLDDAHCDSGTIQGPVSISGTLTGDTLSPAGVAQYTCSHVASMNDIPQFTNTAIVTGQPPTGPPVHGTGIVTANITHAAIQVLKLEKDASSSGGFTTGPINVTEESGHFVVHTINYEIQVTNTGNVPLTLSLNDPRCDAGTIQGPAVITGTLNGDVLSPGGQAQYTCSHRYVQGDPDPFTNTATVTGTPPSGPPVSGTSRVTVTRNTVSPKGRICRSLRTGRVIHYRGHRKPKACRPKKPHGHHGFTG
jgi:plastocyanin